MSSQLSFKQPNTGQNRQNFFSTQLITLRTELPFGLTFKTSVRFTNDQNKLGRFSDKGGIPGRV